MQSLFHNLLTILCKCRKHSLFQGYTKGFPGSSAGKEYACNAGDPGLIPGLGSSPEGIGYPLQYSCLENPHGQRCLAAYSPWDHKGQDVTELQSTAHTHRSRLVVSDSLRPHGLQPTRLLGPWDFPGMNTGVGCRFLLQGIFLIQGSNPGLPHCRQTLYRLSYRATQNQAVSRICPCELQFADSLFQMVLPPMLGNQPALEIVASAASSGFSSDDCLSSISLAWAFQVVVARQSGSVHSHVAQVQRWSAEKSATFFWPKHVIREGGI